MGRRKRGEEPQMRFHAHSGQARVRVNGKVIYLGAWDSPEAKERYHRIVAEWHSTGTASTATSPQLPLCDAWGRTVMSVNKLPAGGTLDIHGLPAGTYTARMLSGGKTLSAPFIKR